jgi:hypothetical protein
MPYATGSKAQSSAAQAATPAIVNMVPSSKRPRELIGTCWW